MVGIAIFFILIFFVPVILFFWNQQRISGKVLCLFLEKNRSATMELNPYNLKWSFVVAKDGYYDLDTELVRLVRYPMGWPKALQQSVPFQMWKRGSTVPIDFITVKISSYSASEIQSVLDENWIRTLVKGVKEGGGISRQERMMLFLSTGLGGITLILLFIVLSKL